MKLWLRLAERVLRPINARVAEARERELYAAFGLPYWKDIPGGRPVLPLTWEEAAAGAAIPSYCQGSPPSSAQAQAP